MRRVFRYLEIDTGRWRSPSACSEILFSKKEAEKAGPVNAAMLRFAFENYGKKVGDGECYAVGQHYCFSTDLVGQHYFFCSTTPVGQYYFF